MKISRINNKNISFGRALTTEEMQRASDVQKQALDYLGVKRIITIIPEPSLPTNSTQNIGHGHLNSEQNDKFFDFWKLYTGATDLKVLPQGELHSNKGYYGTYKSTALTLGTHAINPYMLAKEEMGKLISEATLNSLCKANKSTQKQGLANFENTVGNEAPLNQALKEAFQKFKTSDNATIKILREEFKTYKEVNKETIEGRALFETLTDLYQSFDRKNWSETDRYLFNTDIVTKEKRNARIQELKDTRSDDIEFCYFKQFLADKELKQGKERLNKKGIKLVGDCLIGFSEDEIWAHPKAFLPANIASKDWGLRALDLATLDDKNSAASNLLRLKTKQFAQRYDSIRFDVGWAYVNPIIFPHKDAVLPTSYVKDRNVQDGFRVKKPLGTKALNLIENTVLSVKGQNYDLSNLMYEIEAGPSEFSPFNWDKKTVIPELQGRTIVQSSSYMSDEYATIPFMENTMRVPRKNYVFMAGNHDHLALSALSKGIDTDDILKNNNDDIKVVLQKQYRPLAKGLNMYESTLRSTPKEFARAKMAYNFLAENIKMFFMDIFGRQEQFDSQQRNSSKNYRYMIPENYEQNLHRSIQNGEGFNIFDALYKAVKAKGGDKQKSGLLSELNNYAQILNKRGALSEDEANNAIKKINTSNNSINANKAIKKSNKAVYITVGILGSVGILYKYLRTKNDKNKKVTNS